WHSEDSVLTAVDNMFAKEAKARTSARARSGKLNKKTQFLIWAIDATFEDFPKWWAEKGKFSVTWRQQEIIAKLVGNEALIKNLPVSLTGLDVELSGDHLFIDGKQVTVNQIKSAVPHLVKDS
ncbi:hypothetical protein OAO91_05825, partial [Luminiphilus sp.]|nr:hypothetical protein [Luminiphilus sp.]